MSSAGRSVRLSKVETPAFLKSQRVEATYAVLVDDKVEGHVDKYVQRVMTHPGGRGGSGQRHRTDTVWGWRRRGVADDASGYDSRKDAVAQILRRLEQNS